ncbi:hypothetical protein AMECASPLE_028943 [Ameca splendens]|uniref:Uncharacterized protein n=1 Tax=Ameca splendens TaxID=208324 RepID=A0ABV0XIP3_9TELE
MFRGFLVVQLTHTRSPRPCHDPAVFSLRGAPGTSHREEAQGMAQDTLEGLCLSVGLGTPWALPGGAGGDVWGQGRLGVSAESAAPATRSRIKRKTTSTVIVVSLVHEYNNCYN